MKTKLLLALSLFTFSFAGLAHADPRSIPDALKSPLTQIAQVDGLGSVAYRGPVAGKTGPVLVLVHDAYPGASNLSFRELLPILDNDNYRVFILDMPGAGGSASGKPKQEYTMNTQTDAINRFLQQVVKTPAAIVAEGTSALAALDAAKANAGLVTKVVMLSPTGIRTFQDDPTTAQNLAYKGLMASDTVSQKFYQSLFTDENVIAYEKKAFYNPNLVDSLMVTEAQIAGDNIDQRWLTISYLNDRIHQKFADAALGVTIPTMAIFGANAQSMDDNADNVERPAEFQAAWPQLNVQVIQQCGVAVLKEKPQDVANLIQGFVK